MSSFVTNRISECRATNARKLEQPDTVVIHKTSLATNEPHNPDPVPDELLDCVAMADRFCRGKMGKYTAGKFPYHFLVRHDGEVEQALPLSLRAAHACKHNDHTIGVAYAGEIPNPRQYAALVRLCSSLALHLRGGAVKGHTELDGASANPRKVCPPRELDLRQLAREVLKRLPILPDWRQMPRQRIDLVLKEEGITL